MPALGPALRNLAILGLLLAGGCGGDPSWSASFDFGPATAETRLSVTAWRGTVRLRNSTTGRLEVTVRGEAPLPLDKAVTFAESEGREGSWIRIDAAAKDADLELEVAAPPGITLSCACAEANVEVSGSWARLEVKATAGGIVARVERADSGALESRSGAVLYAATAAGPTGELTAKSMRGDVTVRLPAQWNGQIHAATQTGKLDVPPHGNLRTIWDENRKSLVGHVGPQHRQGEPLATVWGTSSAGNVSLRLEE